MDRFSELEKKLKEAIERLDKQISIKQNEINRNNVKIGTTDESIKSLKESLENIDKKRETVEGIENKNIILYIIESILKNLTQEYLDCVKNKRWFEIISFPILALITIFLISVIIIGGGIPGIMTISALISLYFIGTKLDSIIELHKLKKNYTFVGLSGTREEIIKCIDEYRRDILDLPARNTELYAEIQTLQAEKGDFILDLERVSATKEQIITERWPEILNTAFNDFDMSDIRERIRAREKKEGEE